MECLIICFVNLLFLLDLAVGEIQLDSLQYVGCFKLSDPYLEHYSVQIPYNNLTKCVDTCKAKGSARYAGLGIRSNINSLFCGGDSSEASTKINNSEGNNIHSDINNRTSGDNEVKSFNVRNASEQSPDSSNSVSFLAVGTSGETGIYNSTRLPEYDIILEASEHDDYALYFVDYHYARKLVFTRIKEKLFMMPVSPSFGPVNTTPTLVRVLSTVCNGFAVDWVDDKIYWINWHQGPRGRVRSVYLMRMDLDGTNNEVVKPLRKKNINIFRMVVDPYARMLFWSGYFEIDSINLTSNKVHSIRINDGIIDQALALDRSAHRVYYILTPVFISYLWSMDYTGKNQLRIFALPSSKIIVSGLTLHGGFVFWVQKNESTENLYRAPLKVESDWSMRIVQTTDKVVFHMQVVHPDIQKPPATNYCPYKGCSQTCKDLSDTSEDCQCPRVHTCYCGGHIAEASIRRSNSQCNIKCSDINNRDCGGDELMSLYDMEANVPRPVFKESISFLVGGIGRGARVYNSTRLPEYDTVVPASGNDHEWVHTVDYHYVKNLVFAKVEQKLIMVPVSPSFAPVNTTPTLVRELSDCNGFAVDWVYDKIYWLNCIHGHTLSADFMRMDLDGSNNEVVMSLGEKWRYIWGMEIDPYARMVFWTGYTIESFNLTSNETNTKLIADSAIQQAIALDRSAQRLYYVLTVDQIKYLYSMEYSGGNQLRIFSMPPMKLVSGISLHGGFVYWVQSNGIYEIFYRAPLKIENDWNVQKIQTADEIVFHMRVVHPDIQKPTTTNSCLDQDCSQISRTPNETSNVIS